jgi:hypothetical protein
MEQGTRNMAKAAVKTEVATTEQNLPAAQNGEYSDEMLAMMQEDEGKGVSFKAEDQLIPMIYILQSNSPVVDKRGDAYIEGAEAGHFWLRNSLNPIADGEAGIEVIPVEMVHTWVEWLPQRQGFVMRHLKPPADMASKTVRGDDGRERQVLMRENGNVIQETREFYLLCNGQPFVLPCTGTKHTFARSWQTLFHQFKHPKTGNVLPAYSRKYLLRTVPQSNAVGKWFGLKFEDLGNVSVEEYKAARMFYNAVMEGSKVAEAPISGAEGKEDIPF